MANILLVEDNDRVRFALNALLTDGGHTVIEAVNGKHALQNIEYSAFDIVITDMYMPVMDGIELILEVRKSHPDLKIIAISGGTALQLAEFSLNFAGELGADVTMQKPLDNDALLGQIDTLLQTAA